MFKYDPAEVSQITQLQDQYTILKRQFLLSILTLSLVCFNYILYYTYLLTNYHIYLNHPYLANCLVTFIPISLLSLLEAYILRYLVDTYLIHLKSLKSKKRKDL